MNEQNDTMKDKLVHAYDNMMENLHVLIEQADQGNEKAQDMLKKARDQMVDADTVTREEAEKVSQYLKRDLRNASEYLEDKQHNLADWLHMDMELLEWNITDLFLQTADKTKLDLLLLEENAKHVNEYHTGEVTGPGLLVCDNCKEELKFNKTGHIPPCPKCHKTNFSRQSR
ncbi:MAG: zinc ribbon-containing protein [Gammaproteobacteria bacterium]|nr:zinc ribbon-containing protein [Gammaproteobacteria bacterium]